MGSRPWPIAATAARLPTSHAALDASQCICQPDVISSKWGEEELLGCQLASNGVDDATGNGPGLEVEAAVCWGASASMRVVHMEAAGGGDDVADHKPEGFRVAVLRAHPPQPCQHRLHSCCRSRCRGTSQHAEGREVPCCMVGGSWGGKEARAVLQGEGGKQQGGRERRVGPAKPRQQHSRRIIKRRRLQQPSSQLSSSSPGGMQPRQWQCGQQRRQPLHSTAAAGKGGKAAKHGDPDGGVGSAARCRGHRLLQVKEMAQGVTAAAEKSMKW
ncbi:hypothetical protein ACK3TF_001932 [Chlorella vulgaris]